MGKIIGCNNFSSDFNDIKNVFSSFSDESKPGVKPKEMSKLLKIKEMFSSPINAEICLYLNQKNMVKLKGAVNCE